MKSNDLTDLSNLIDKEKAILLYFYNDDCAPCVSLRPKVEHLLVSFFPRMKFIFVDSKHDPKIPASFGAYASPSLLIFFEGKEFMRFSKYISLKELEAAIRKYYILLFEKE
jgi:thioredoxin-like negative regulator of GroEL